jgi:mRNA-degrading endonuclease RelE of RelBE toxin-antitoxin system
LPYRLEISEDALSKLEDLGQADAKRLRQVFIKIASLRRNPHPQDSKKLENFSYKGISGYRTTQGEFRIIYAEKGKRVFVCSVLNRNEDYRELRRGK